MPYPWMWAIPVVCFVAVVVSSVCAQRALREEARRLGLLDQPGKAAGKCVSVRVSTQEGDRPASWAEARRRFTGNFYELELKALRNRRDMGLISPEQFVEEEIAIMRERERA